MTTISISGVIGWDVTPDSVRAQLKEAKGDLLVEIGSPGGFVYDGIEIFNIIRDYKGGTVTTKLMGIAASMASYIALAGEKVTAHDNAIYMIHNAMTYAAGNQNDMREVADHLEKLSNHLAKSYVKKTGKPLSEVKKMMDSETWLYGSEMVEAGFVDEIIETENEDDKDSAMIQAKASFSNCKEILQDSSLKEDLKKAAASISTIITPSKNNIDLNSANPDNKKNKNEEKIIMEKLSEILAKNSEALAEYKSAIDESKEAGKNEVKANIEVAKNFLTNDKYPATVHAVALKVLTGEESASTLTAVVAAVDAVTAQSNSNLGIQDSNDIQDTPPEGNAPEEDVSGNCETEEQFQAELKRNREENK